MGKSGWYWVKYIDHPDPLYWECKYYDGASWEDHSPVIVGPRIEPPNQEQGN